MELAAQSHVRGMSLRAHWIPRLQNEEADALSNFSFDGFDAAKRINVDLDTLNFMVLNELFQEGDGYITDLEKIKASEKSKPHAAERGKRKRRGSALKDTAPW